MKHIYTLSYKKMGKALRRNVAKIFYGSNHTAKSLAEKFKFSFSLPTINKIIKEFELEYITKEHFKSHKHFKKLK